MTMSCLVSGTLHRDPTPRTGKESSRNFMTCLLRVETGADTVWANIIAFSEHVIAELMRLKQGDSIAVQGNFRLSTYESKSGETRVSMDIIASCVLALRQEKKRKHAQAELFGISPREVPRVSALFSDDMGTGNRPPRPQSPPFDDDLPEF